LEASTAQAAPKRMIEDDVVRVTAAGPGNRKSMGDEVIIVRAATMRGLLVDLPRLAGDTYDLMRPVYVGNRPPLPFGIKLTRGQSIDLPLGRGGSLHLICHPWSGRALIETAGRQRAFDLFAEAAEIIEVDLAGLLPLKLSPDEQLKVPDTIAANELSQELQRRMAGLIQQRQAVRHLPASDALAVYTPRWKGVSAATLNLFPFALPIPLTPAQHPDDLDAAAIEVIADVLADVPFQTIVFSGGDFAFYRVFEACRRRRPALDMRLLWHSSYIQMGEPHDWNLLTPWFAAAQARQLVRVGVVKPGMERFLAAHGVDAVFVQNSVPFKRRRDVEPVRPDVVGMWMSGSSDYRKPVVPSLIAIAGLPQVRLRAAGLGELGARVADELKIQTLVRFINPIPHADVLAHMRQTAASLYVTLSECMPMVPLESMAQGAPCVVGPATELFMDEPELADLLVVRDPNDPVAIRCALAGVLEDRTRLRERCADYLEALNARAARDLVAFLS
jgi:hypothetical protein